MERKKFEFIETILLVLGKLHTVMLCMCFLDILVFFCNILVFVLTGLIVHIVTVGTVISLIGNMSPPKKAC